MNPTHLPVLPPFRETLLPVWGTTLDTCHRRVSSLKARWRLIKSPPKQWGSGESPPVSFFELLSTETLSSSDQPDRTAAATVHTLADTSCLWQLDCGCGSSFFFLSEPIVPVIKGNYCEKLTFSALEHLFVRYCQLTRQAQCVTVVFGEK